MEKFGSIKLNKITVIKSGLPLLLFEFFLLFRFLLTLYFPDELSVELIFLQCIFLGIIGLYYLPCLDVKSICLFSVLMVLFVLSYITHLSGFEYMCNTFAFCLILLISAHVKITRKEGILCSVCLCLLCFFIFMFAERGDAQLNFEDFQTALIPLNPNSSAFILFLLFTILWEISYNKNKAIKLLLRVACAILVIGQFFFISRTAFMGLVLYWFVRIGVNYYLPSPKVGKIITWVLGIGSLIFVIGYLILYQIIGHGQLTILGKDIFTGRQIIWLDAFDQLKNHWIFGIGNHLNSLVINGDQSGVTNLHNQVMGYLMVFGLPVMISYILFYAYLVKLFLKRKAKATVCFLIVLLLMSYFDTILYSTANITLIIFSFIIIRCFEGDSCYV